MTKKIYDTIKETIITILNKLHYPNLDANQNNSQ